MTQLRRLPNRPLSSEEVTLLDSDDQLRVVPYGGVPEGDEVRVYAVKMETDGTAHALGFDDAENRWQHLTARDATDVATADSQLDAVLDEWAQNNYGGRFEVLKTI